MDTNFFFAAFVAGIDDAGLYCSGSRAGCESEAMQATLCL
jgi:hypothetical protein